MRPVFKFNKHDKAKEREIELNYLKSLTVQQRFQMCFQKSKEMKELLKRSGRRKAFKVIKRA